MFNDLLQLFFTYGISLPPELSTFFRALITLEGTLTTLSPGYPVIDRAEAIATEWMRARLAPSTLEELPARSSSAWGRCCAASLGGSTAWPTRSSAATSAPASACFPIHTTSTSSQSW